MNFIDRASSISLVVVVLLFEGTAAGTAQSVKSLKSLTVPASSLPQGCALERLPPTASPGDVRVVDVVTGAGFSENPWVGADRTLVAAIRKAIDGLPPGIPESKLAENVIEAYRAAYLSPEGARAEVYAVTFNDVKLAREEPPSGSNRIGTLSARRVVGTTVMKLVSATSPANWCFDPIQTFLGSVK